MEEIKTIGGHQLPRGADGGHYTPVVTQPTADTMTVGFQPSKAGMAAVEPVEIKLPVGSGDGAGQNFSLDTTLTQSGKAADAKAVGDALAELEEKIQEGGASCTLPVANASTLGGVKLPPKTDAHTEEATVGPDGRVWVKPPAQSITEVGGVEFTNHVGNLYSPDNHLTKLPALGDNVLALTGGSQKYLIFRAKPDTTYVCTYVIAPGMGNFGQADFAGICTQVPGTPAPVDRVSIIQTGGYGKYFVMRTNANFRNDTAYLIWQLGGSSDLTNVAIYEGDSIEGYDTINPYSPENGIATSDDLVIRPRNLDAEISKQLHRGNTAVQPEDLAAEPAKTLGSTDSYEFLTQREIGDSAIGEWHTLINSAVASKEFMDTQIRLGKYYAHCPSVCIKDGKAYVVCFQNTKDTTDTYILEESSTELFVVDIATMTELGQYKIAGHGDTVGDLTFTYGSGAAQGVLVDDATLRCVFVAKLSDEEWHQCYRDYDITSGTFGDIGLCQITKDGMSYPFTTGNASLYIQEIADTTINTNIVCQPAQVGDTWYVACGCRDQWDNMPILKTEDWISFEYWATPSVEGNKAKFEMAITTDGTHLYTATRQIDSVECVQVMKVSLADGSVSDHIAIPDGNRSRPFLIYKNGTLYVAHILTAQRGNSSQITFLQTNALYIGPRGGITLPPMTYPAIAECAEGYFIAFMKPYELRCCKVSSIVRYGNTKVIGIAAKLIELVAGE